MELNEPLTETRWRSVRRWWAKGVIATNHYMTQRELEERRSVREYYTTHLSARLVVWGVVLGVLIDVVGMVMCGSNNGTKSDFGYVVVVLGLAVTFVSSRFAANVRASRIRGTVPSSFPQRRSWQSVR